MFVFIFRCYGQVPQFYSSQRSTVGFTKQDEDIFDFTDSRLINPPRENSRNYPLVQEQVNTVYLMITCKPAV